MTKVYIVEEEDFDRFICGVFSTRQLAEAYVDVQQAEVLKNLHNRWDQLYKENHWTLEHEAGREEFIRIRYYNHFFISEYTLDELVQPL